MKPDCVDLTEAATSVRLLKINGFRGTNSMDNSDYLKSKWNVDGYEWEVRCYPRYSDLGDHWVFLKLIFMGRAGARSEKHKVWATLSCCLVDPTKKDLGPSRESSVSKVFSSPEDSSSHLKLVKRCEIIKAPSPAARGCYLQNDGSVTVQCTITVLREVPDIFIPPATMPLPMPSNLHQHLGELLKNQKGADITFILASGERFLAHKNILAARSPVFMAEFFGHMSEQSSKYVEIKDMEAAVFEAMLGFIYTDTAPELDDEQPETAVTMAQHLLAAADRYGLDRLKQICEAKLCGSVDVETAATTLALAEQHGWALLKAWCIEFIIGSPENLDAVVVTEGYRHLAATCPLVLADILKAARGRKN